MAKITVPMLEELTRKPFHEESNRTQEFKQR